MDSNIDIFKLCYKSGINNNKITSICSEEELQYNANKFTEVINTIYNQNVNNINSISNTVSTYKNNSNTDDIFDIFKYFNSK